MEQPNSIYVGGTYYETGLTAKYRKRKRYQKQSGKNICAEIPGIVRELLATPGQQVRSGQGLLVLEAMKMQNILAAPIDGEVVAIRVVTGQNVAKGDVLIELR